WMATDRKSFNIPPSVFVMVLGGLALGLFALQIVLKQHAPSSAAVLISEFCAHNGSGIRDEDSDHSDWIELYNPGDQSVNLEGWFLTDSFYKLTKWQFPKYELLPEHYLVIFASGKNRRQADRELHTNFKLKDSGEYLALVMSDGVTIAQDFFPKYPRQKR